jgi:dihydroorotate dehydrogenase (NAD+) catalytic subunit
MGLDNEKLQIELNGLKLKNPVITASGTFGYCDEYEEFIDVKRLGSIITKALTLEPRKGNSTKRIMEVKSAMINSIGLENMGIHAFLENVLPKLYLKNINFILNIAGRTKEEYIELAKICEENEIQSIEVNVSCPNVKSGCLEFGTDEETIYELISEIREKYSKVLIVKLSPNVTSIEKMAVAAQNAGASIISAINTIKAMGIKLNFSNGSFKSEKIMGGLSGSAVKPVALRAINSIYRNINIPIIGMGGINTLEDIFEFVAVGADAVQIGTANFTRPTVSVDLVNELESFINKNNFKDFNELKNKLRESIDNE